MQIILVEDNFALRLSLGASLRQAGYEVLPFGSAEEADAAVAVAEPAAAVVDWMLPGQSGIDLLRSWRQAGRGFPVIVLTARDAVDDRVQGLDAGADDYLVKPFATEELLARIRVCLRGRATGSALTLSGCTVDLARGVVRRGDQEIELTTKEVELLRFLAANPGRNLDRDELHRKVWGHVGQALGRSVDNAVARLRTKVEDDPKRPRHILTVHGAGYRFEA